MALNGDDPRRSGREPRSLRTRERTYLATMGVVILLIALAWGVVWRYSLTAAIAMSAVALVVPPFAAIIANAGPMNRQ
jgi:Protein of unknown function (DUF3099)